MKYYLILILLILTVQSSQAQEEDNIIRGSKQYELTNHLGNVLATISDRNTIAATAANGSSGIITELITATDYYAFGMQMPGRNFSSDNYRFGFNGKENDNDVKGDGNEQDYGMRIYDPRIARFLSVDPLAKEYAWYTPYQFAGNKPIEFVDLDGQEETKPKPPPKRPVIKLPPLPEEPEELFFKIGVEMSPEDIKKKEQHQIQVKLYYALKDAYNKIADEYFQQLMDFELYSTMERNNAIDVYNSTHEDKKMKETPKFVMHKIFEGGDFNDYLKSVEDKVLGPPKVAPKELKKEIPKNEKEHKKWRTNKAGTGMTTNSKDWATQPKEETKKTHWKLRITLKKE